MSRDNYDVRSLRDDPPFVVRLRLPRELADLEAPITGYTLAYIEKKAQSNEARNLFADAMESDQRAFEDLVNMVAEITMFYIEVERLDERRWSIALENAARVAVDGFMVEYMHRHRSAFERLNLSNEMLQSMDDYSARLRDLYEDIKDYARSARSDRGRDDRDLRSSRRDYRDDRDDRRDRDDRDYDRNRRDNREERSDSGEYRRRRRNPNVGNGLFGGADVQENETNSGNHRRRRLHGPAREETIQNKRITVINGREFFPIGDDEWPKCRDRNNPWDWILMENGVQIRPAFKSGWNVTFDFEKPRTPYYNPQTHFLFHALSLDGKVSELIVDRTAEMDKYLDFELDPALRRIAESELKSREEKSAQLWKTVESLKLYPDRPLATSNPVGEDGEELEVVVQPKAISPTTSLAQAVKRDLIQMRLNNPKDADKGFEVYHDRLELSSSLVEDRQALYGLVNAESFSKLHELLSKMLPSDGLRVAVNQRITSAVNRALAEEMGLTGWSISSFVDDIGDLLKFLKEDYGDRAVEALGNVEPALLGSYLTVVEEADLEEAAAMFDLTNSEKLLLWTERCSTTYLPVNFEELSLPVGNGMLVTQAHHSGLYQSLSAIFGRTEDFPRTYMDRYIVTANDVVLKMVRGAFNPEAILVYRVANLP